MKSKASDRVLFPGSFNPFTLGHKDIVDRALAMFGEVVIAIGVNVSKPDGQARAEARAEVIRRYFPQDAPVRVLCYHGLTTDLARQTGASALLRGVRSVRDFEYERDMAEVNRQLSGIETVLLFSNPRYSAISSSVVRELQAFGQDITEFIPTPVR